MIPKVIHYCWFGGNPLPELALKCIESWKKFCPDYEIKEWNETNYDVRSCRYISEAYDAGKWAFVSDYARFDILYKYGGIYFDTDVELVSSIDDILQRGPFMGTQKGNPIIVAPGLGIAAAEGMPIYKSILDFYKNKSFYYPDGSPNTTTVVTYTTKILKEFGLKNESEEIQCVGGIYIYPHDYFSPVDFHTGRMEITDNTRSIHHYYGSWNSESERKYTAFRQYCNAHFGAAGIWIYRFYRFILHPKELLCGIRRVKNRKRK